MAKVSDLIKYELLGLVQQLESERDALRAEIGAKARMSIELGIFERMLDPEWEGEFSAIDSEYMHHVHERLYSVLKENRDLKAEIEAARNQEPIGFISLPDRELLLTHRKNATIQPVATWMRSRLPLYESPVAGFLSAPVGL